jgi:RNA polymerase sporulation-specific sigma factor
MESTARAGYPLFDWDDDEDLVRLAKMGNSDATRRLLTKYQYFVRVKAHSYFLAGGDGDDLLQEGYIGLFKAIRDYRPDRAHAFRGFAELCVTRQIITAIKTASRQKHSPLNTYISFSYSPAGSGYEDRTLADLIPSGRTSDPVQQVLRHYLEGLSYEDIAELIEHDTKTVDNALQRIKRKVLLHLESRRVLG